MRVILKNNGIDTPEEVIKACEGDKIAARILFNRGITSYEKAIETIDITKYKPYNPKEFPNIEKAIHIIKNSLDNKEKIAVYGDYDVDGVTATSILVSAIREIGGDVVYHVPDRFTEGYGMNLDVIEMLNKQGVKTIITCDCGISNFDEIDKARELGMKVILTDHHTIGQNIPKADVVINPKLLEDGHPAKEISGGATAYYLVKVLFEEEGRDDAEEYLDLVALSLIADVIPLTKEARYLLKKGMPLILNSSRIGMQAIKYVIGGEIKNKEDIAFQIAPRINAAGRMDSARVPVELFLTKDSQTALELAKKINGFNIDRKVIQKDIFEMADAQVKDEKRNKKILVLYGASWHHGIIGIVAGRICELYKRPTILLTLNEDGETIGGSARSPEGINIYEVLSKYKEYLIKFGGHSGAAGLSLGKDRLNEFTKAIEKYADIYITEDEKDIIYADIKMSINEISEEVLDSIDSIAPYGESFESPVFYSENVTVIADRVLPLGHHFMVLEDENGNKINAVIWNGIQESLQEKHCGFVYSIYKDFYNGANEIKLKIEGIIPDTEQKRERNIVIIDRRGIEIHEILKEFNNSVIFYEGPTAFKPDLKCSNIDGLVECENIILYSFPKNNKSLEQIVEITKAKRVILNYSYVPDYSIQGFSKMFLGMIKSCMNNCHGSCSIKRAAEIMNVEEEFIITFSKYIKSCGYADFKREGDYIHYERGNNKGTRNEYLERVIARYLEEKTEYIKGRRFYEKIS